MEISKEEYKKRIVDLHIDAKTHFRRIIFRAMWDQIYFYYVKQNLGVRFNENRVYYMMRDFYKRWFFSPFMYYIDYNVWHNNRINITYKEENNGEQ